MLPTIATAEATASLLDVDFNYLPTDYRKSPVLRGVAQVLALNANGVSFGAGAALSCTVTWNES